MPKQHWASRFPSRAPAGADGLFTGAPGAGASRVAATTVAVSAATVTPRESSTSRIGCGSKGRPAQIEKGKGE